MDQLQRDLAREKAVDALGEPSTDPIRPSEGANDA